MVDKKNSAKSVLVGLWPQEQIEKRIVKKAK